MRCAARAAARLGRGLAALAWASAFASAFAQSVSLSGSLGDKALLIIDGAPRTLAVGASVQGVRLLSVSGSNAVVDIKGQRVALTLGGAQVNLAATTADGGASRIVLSADSGGHFITSGSINGKSARFLVDTGATNLALSQSEAQSLGIDYRKGDRGTSMTANGPVPVYRVMLASVRVGEVQVYNVEATIVPMQMPFVLLGNSFLTRFQMKRENDVLTLTKRF
ncbi:MAG: retroviral-like aspartic protease family protein [Bacteriovorax sp.]|nr:retroviral-like aspartic protease family protein [Rhizobacter sp.]